MKSKAATVSEYLKEVPDERRPALTKLRAMIRKAAPDATEAIEFGMASYRLGEMLFGLASQKNHMALYCCETDVVEAYRDGLGKLDCGKGCIRFKKLEQVPLDVIEKILHAAADRRRRGKTGREPKPKK